jgi:DNA-binding SARP family transcriptional activator
VSALSVDVLGPLAVSLHGRPVAVTAGRLRTLLVMLALSVGEPVSVDRLTTALWGDDLPDDPKGSIQTYVTRLRAALGSDAIGITSAGYVLRTAADRIDATRFAQLLDAAAAAHDADAERERLVEALALWRGTPFEDLRSGWLQEIELPGLNERYLGALERRIDLDLADGRHVRLAPELRRLTIRYPFRERLWGQLMLALYRSGQQGHALEVYLSLHRLLVDELGIEPGEAVRDLHRRILAADPTLNLEPDRRRDSVLVPHQLPADARDFIGRIGNLNRLDSLLPADDTEAPTAVVISAIAGMAGVGKTALALHWAHQVVDRFPDGTLYVNLRGFDPAAAVLSPSDALRGFLHALGVLRERIPTDLREQADLYRSLLASRRVLVVLDNARNAEQVRPLLPGTPGCLAMITSRNELSGLVAVEAAHPIVVDLFTPAEAWQFLAARLGPDRIAADRQAAEEIIRRCARLPLALAVVAARAALHPGFRLAALADELRDSQRRLDALAGDEPTTDIRSVFSWSYRILTPAAARLFRLLALSPGPDIAMPAIASLGGLPLARTRSLITELTQTYLIMEQSPGRYAFHDLLRAYAADLVHRVDADADRHTALTRLLDHYVHTAYAADQLAAPNRGEIPLPLAAPRRDVQSTPMTKPDDAVVWLISEGPALRAMLQLDTDASLDTRIWQLAWSLYTISVRRGDWHGLEVAGRRALHVAMRLDDPTAQAAAHYFLGLADAMLGRQAAADAHCEHALDLYGRSGDLIGQANTLNHLGMMAELRGRPTDALQYARQALALFQAAGHRFGEAKVLNAIGWCHTLLGDHEQAIVHCGRALTLFQELGDRETEAAAWDSLGHAHHHLGRYPDAVNCFDHALDICREFNDRFREATVLEHLGDARNSSGDSDRAHAAWRQTLLILDDINPADADRVRAKLQQNEPPAAPDRDAGAPSR